MGTYAHVRLLLLSAVIALTARGYPANRKIMPSPLWKNRPTTLLYPHRKLSRPWLVKLQEELWKDGPSGDGPDDTWSSLLISQKSRVGHVSESEYKTHSPSAEDFFSSQVLPFPTIIDTMMDESSTFGEEWISRTSMPYEGPSSLLNSFIFRPSLPHASPSSIKTPLLEEVATDSGGDFSSWWDQSSFWRASNRQAVSDHISDRFVIITAISATHIDSEGTSYSDIIPSRLPSGISSTLSFVTVENLATATQTDTLVEVSSVASGSVFTPVLPSDSRESQFYSTDNVLSGSYDFGHIHSFTEIHPSLDSQIFLSSSNISISLLQTYFYSDTLSRATDMPYITQNYSNRFDNTLFLDLSPYADVSISKMDGSAGLHFEQTHSIGSTFLMNTQILYDFNASFYTTTSFKSFLTSNIQTTVTFYENESQSDRFIMPTLTVRGTSTTEAHSGDLHEVSFSSRHSEQGTEFPHIASSFTDFYDIIPVISLWSLDVSSVENIISHEDTRTSIKEEPFSDDFVKLQRTSEQNGASEFTPATAYPILTSVRSLLSDNEIENDKQSSPLEVSKFSSEAVNRYIEYSTPRIPSSEQMFTHLTPQLDSPVTSSRQSWLSEIGIHRSRSYSEHLNFTYKISSVLYPNTDAFENDSLPVLTQMSYPTTVSTVYKDDLFPSVLLSSKGTLTVNYQSQQEMTPTIASVLEIMSTNDETSHEKGILQTPPRSATEFIDPSTHHVTVRSLSSSYVIDISESMLLNYFTSSSSDIDVSKVASRHTLSPIINVSAFPENVTDLDERTFLPEEINTQEYSPTFLESSFQEFQNLNHTTQISAQPHSVKGSPQSHELESSEWSPGQSIKGLEEIRPSLSEKEVIGTLSLPVQSYQYSLTYPLFTIPSDIQSKKQLADSNKTFTESFTETLRTRKSVNEDTLYFFPTKILSPQVVFTNYHNESITVSQEVHSSPSPQNNGESIPTHDISSQTVIESDESFNSYVKSIDVYSDMQIRPSKTLSDLAERSKLEANGFEHSLTESPYGLSERTSVTEYVKTSKIAKLETNIESSMTFSHLTGARESELTDFRHSFSTEDYVTSKTPYIQSNLQDESLFFSKKDYLSEDFFHTSNIISTSGILPTEETYLNSFLLTPIIPWEVSRQILDYSSDKHDKFISSYEKLVSEESPSSIIYSKYSSPIFSSDTISRQFHSEMTSPGQSVLSFYTESDIMGSLHHSYYSVHSSSSELISSYYFDGSVYTNIIPILPSSFFTTNVATEINSFPISSTIFREGSKIPPEFSSPRFEGEPTSGIRLQSSSSFIPIFASKEESTFYRQLSESTQHTNLPLNTVVSSDWVGGLRPETDSNYREGSARSVESVFFSDESVFNHYSTELKPGQSTMYHGESSRISRQHPETDTHQLKTLSDSISAFDFADKTAIYPPTPVFTPGQSVRTQEFSWIGAKSLGGDTDTQTESPVSFVPVFSSEEESAFNHYIPELTLSSQWTVHGKYSTIEGLELDKSFSKIDSSHLGSFVDASLQAFTSKGKSTVYHMPELTASTPPTSFTSKGKSIAFHTLDLTPITPLTTLRKSTVTYGQESGEFLTKIDSSHSESFVDISPQSFTSEAESKVYHTLDQTPILPLTTLGISRKIDELESGSFIPIVDPSHSESFVGASTQSFISKVESKFYHTPELTPVPSVTTLGKSGMIGGLQSDEFLTKIDSSHSESFVDISPQSFASEAESKVYHTADQTPILPLTTLGISRRIDELESGSFIPIADPSHSESFVGASTQSFISKVESKFYHTPELTPIPPVTTLGKSSMVGGLESDEFLTKIDSSHSESFVGASPHSFSSKVTSKVYHTPELTPIPSVTTLGKSSMIDGLESDEFLTKIDSSHSESFVGASPHSFSSKVTSEVYHTPEVTPILPFTAFEKSSIIGGVESERFLPHTDSKHLEIIQATSQRFTLKEESNVYHTLKDESNVYHTLKEESNVYHTLELTPSQPVITHGESHWTNGKHPEGKFLTEIASSHLKSSAVYIPALVSEETAFFQRTPVLTPIPSAIKHEETSCVIPPCSITSESKIQRRDELTLLRESSPSTHENVPFSSAVHLARTSEHIRTESASHILNSTLSLPKDIKPFESEILNKTREPTRVESDFRDQKPTPKSIESEHPFKTEYSVKKPDTKSIESDYPVKKPDPKSIDSDHPRFSMHLTKSVLFPSTLVSFRSQPATPFPVLTSTDHLSISRTIKKDLTQQIATTTALDSTKQTPTWPKESSTPGYDVEMASVLAISSFFGINSSRNASSGLENSGISESEWSRTEVKPTPSMDFTLFKDNNYWILTVLEAPIKGHLPENFSQTLELRLANAYSEAFRIRSGKQGNKGKEDNIVVKILSLTNDLLLSQLDIVYVVERAGTLVPASLASEFLNFLRHEQLREFLGLYAILKAKPYRPDESAEAEPVSQPLTVVTIVCSILGFLLLLFCCCCIYCRCCRPKQAEDPSPTSSASGSLQRSLAKHGQHNRKHLFQEMAHHLTTEMVAQRKQESAATDIYIPEKEPPPPGKTLPPLPSKDQADAIDKAMKMLKILENKDASTSPITKKRPEDKEKSSESTENSTDSKKILAKPKKRRKAKESQEKSSSQKLAKDDIDGELRPLPPLPKEEDVATTTTPEENRASPDSGTSSRHTSSSPTSTSEKTSEELGSDASNAELLPPLQDLIAKSKADSAAAAADTQVHLSRVRQRISELLDDAFALANGRKFGSMRSKKIDPATEMFPRYASLRSQSAAECSVTRHEETPVTERRPISEGAQHLLGAITDDGQLITRPPPKSVWDHTDLEDPSADAGKHPDVTEAHNRHVNFFPFQQQSKLRQISASSTASLPVLDTLQESQVTASTLSTINVLREAASEVYLAHSSKIHPAAVDQYDEIDVVSALREGEPVADLIRAIKDELQKFSGTLPGANNESNA